MCSIGFYDFDNWSLRMWKFVESFLLKFSLIKLWGFMDFESEEYGNLFDG